MSVVTAFVFNQKKMINQNLKDKFKSKIKSDFNDFYSDIETSFSNTIAFHKNKKEKLGSFWFYPCLYPILVVLVVLSLLISNPCSFCGFIRAYTQSL